MKSIQFVIIMVGSLFLEIDLSFSAHILGPLGTEISSTPPRGRMFGQIEYLYTKNDSDKGAEITTHRLPLEFEVGVGERT